MKERSNHSLPQPEGKHKTAESAYSQWRHMLQSKASGTVCGWPVQAGQVEIFRSRGVGMQRDGRSLSLEMTSLSEGKPRPPCCGGGKVLL